MHMRSNPQHVTSTCRRPTTHTISNLTASFSLKSLRSRSLSEVIASLSFLKSCRASSFAFWNSSFISSSFLSCFSRRLWSLPWRFFFCQSRKRQWLSISLILGDHGSKKKFYLQPHLRIIFWTRKRGSETRKRTKRGREEKGKSSGWALPVVTSDLVLWLFQKLHVTAVFLTI